MIKEIASVLDIWGFFIVALSWCIIVLLTVFSLFFYLYLIIIKRRSNLQKTPLSKLIWLVFGLIFVSFMFHMQYRISPIDIELFKPWKITPDRSYLTIKYIKETKHFGQLCKTVDSYSFNPKNKIIGNAGSDGKVRFWSTENGKLLKTFDKRGSPGIVDFSPDGNFFVLKDENNNITIWTTSDYQLVKTIPNPVKETIYSLRFSSDGKMIVSANCCDSQNKSNIKLFSTVDWSQIASIEGHLVGLGNNVDIFSPDSKILTMNPSDDDLSICLWSIDKNELIGTIGRRYKWNYAFCFSPDGSIIAVSEVRPRSIELWSTSTVELVKEIQVKNGGTQICALRFSPDGKYIAWGHRSYWLERSVSVINPVKLVSVDTGEQIKAFGGRIEQIDYIDFTSDGKTIMAAGKSIHKYDESDMCFIKFWSVE